MRAVVTPAAVLPLSLAEAKLHLRVPHSGQDSVIIDSIKAAERHMLRTHGLVLTSATWDFTPADLEGEEFDGFPRGGDDIRVPMHPLQSVTSVTYVDEDGVSQTLDSDVYVVVPGSVPGRIRLAYDQCWPAARSQPNAVVVRAVFGYGDAGSDVPANLRHAIRLLAGHWYEHRESAADHAPSKAIDQAVDMLIRDEAILGVI